MPSTYRAAALLALSSLLLTPACAMTSSSKKGVMAGGAVASLLGIGLISHGATPVDADHNGVNEWSGDDDYSTPLAGVLLLLGGLVVMSAGLGAPTLPDTPPVPPIVVTATVEGAPGQAPTLRIVQPAIATPEVLARMGEQVRVTAARGECEAAWATLRDIDRRAPDYGRSLAEGPAMAPCLVR